MLYTDLVGEIPVKMNGHTSIVEINSEEQWIYSKIGQEYIGGDKYYKGV